MLRELIKVAALLAAGMMVHDINKAGFVNSDVYKFLDENGIVEYYEMFMGEVKTLYNNVAKLYAYDSPDDYTDMCADVHIYLDLLFDTLSVWKNSIVSFYENSSYSFGKNFPTAVDDVSKLVSGAFTSTKEGLEILTSRLQNFTLSAVNYANEALRT